MREFFREFKALSTAHTPARNLLMYVTLMSGHKPHSRSYANGDFATLIYKGYTQAWAISKKVTVRKQTAWCSGAVCVVSLSSTCYILCGADLRDTALAMDNVRLEVDAGQPWCGFLKVTGRTMTIDGEDEPRKVTAVERVRAWIAHSVPEETPVIFLGYVTHIRSMSGRFGERTITHMCLNLKGTKLLADLRQALARGFGSGAAALRGQNDIPMSQVRAGCSLQE